MSTQPLARQLHKVLSEVMATATALLGDAEKVAEAALLPSDL